MRTLAFLPLAASLAALVPAALIAQSAVPAPRAVPLTETVHGITLNDEYRWMEDPATRPEWSAWVGGESQRTRSMLDGLPVRGELADLIASTSSSLTRQGNVQQAAGTRTWFRTLPGEQSAKLMVSDAKGLRVLVDPAAVAGDKLMTMGAYALSPDGRTVAVHLSSGGSEVGKIHFFDVATGKEAYPALPNMWGEGAVTFLPGGLIAYNQMPAEAVDGDISKGTASFIRPLAGGPQTLVFGKGAGGADVSPEEFPIVFAPPASPFVVGVGAGARADQNFFLAPRAGLLAGKPQWVRLAGLADRVGTIALRGNQVYMVTSRTNSARDLVVQGVDARGKAVGPVRTVMAGTPDLIVNDAVATRDGIYVVASSDGVMRLFHTPGGKVAPREITLPFEGTGSVQTLPDGSGLVLALTGWTRNASSYVVRGTRISALGIESGVWSGAKDVVAERYEAISADGTRVPLVVTRLKSATGRVPTLIEAYGGYGIDTATPFYNRNAMAFLAKGGAMAYCGVRGGGERGRAWHEGGRGPNKPRGQEDLIACAETLTAKGIAPERGPVVMGSSMAGVLVPAAVLRKPAAFGGMITRVGVVNATRIANAENGANQFQEVGNPANSAQFADLLAMDAYQMLPKASGLPPTMMVIGMNDRRVAPWMTAKFVARAQAKWPQAPIYLRSDDKAGHGVGSTEDVRRSEWADIFAFTWWAQTK